MDKCGEYNNLMEKLNFVINSVIFQEDFNNIKELGETLKEIINTNDESIYNSKELYILLLLLKERNFSSTLLDILINNVKYKSIFNYIFEGKNEEEHCCVENNDKEKENFKIFKNIEEDNEEKTVITFKQYEDGTEEIIDTVKIKKPDANSLDELFAGFLNESIEEKQED